MGRLPKNSGMPPKPEKPPKKPLKPAGSEQRLTSPDLISHRMSTNFSQESSESALDTLKDSLFHSETLRQIDTLVDAQEASTEQPDVTGAMVPFVNHIPAYIQSALIAAHEQQGPFWHNLACLWLQELPDEAMSPQVKEYLVSFLIRFQKAMRMLNQRTVGNTKGRSTPEGRDLVLSTVVVRVREMFGYKGKRHRGAQRSGDDEVDAPDELACSIVCIALNELRAERGLAPVRESNVESSWERIQLSATSKRTRSRIEKNSDPDALVHVFMDIEEGKP